MRRHQWSKLNKQQVGTYFEYFVKMELTMFGYQVYTTEVDDRSVDFIARRGDASSIEVQAKSLRDFGYVYLRKAHFKPRNGLYVALGLLFDGNEPDAYLIPSMVWFEPDGVFVERNYGQPGQVSQPEWGINVYRGNMPALRPYALSTALGWD